MRRLYAYEGEVYAFDSLVMTEWKAETWAVSEEKAKANLKFRFRNEYNLSKITPLLLPGRFKVIAEHESPNLRYGFSTRYTHRNYYGG